MKATALKALKATEKNDDKEINTTTIYCTGKRKLLVSGEQHVVDEGLSA